jgi:hypothetical protein
MLHLVNKSLIYQEVGTPPGLTLSKKGEPLQKSDPPYKELVINIINMAKVSLWRHLCFFVSQFS